jgi:hypothetical protein
MSEVLLFEFDGVTTDDYNAVDKMLGTDGRTGSGDFPAGLLSHVAAQSATGLVVCEVWDSRPSQDRFMRTRLGPALGELGVPAPKRVEWLTLVGCYPAGIARVDQPE